jgi:2-polyprenyl-3-methyl-5-hydroxy-6-metoxy-1,4-benzoquinol methylase
MSIEDKCKWDEKYAAKPQLLQLRPPSPTLVCFAQKAPGKYALDLACGAGRNALFLANEGFCVDAVDIAEAPLKKLDALEEGGRITTYCADLDDFEPPRRYDLIVMANFLDRKLIERMKSYLNEGGLFIVETYMAHPDNEKKDSDASYLLRDEELKKLFDNFDIMCYNTFWNEPYEMYRMRKQAIAAKNNG